MNAAVGLAEKVAGQTRSAHAATDAQRAAFLDVIRALPAGAEVSVNALRTTLDELGVPPRARGGLFYGAATPSSGLLVAGQVTSASGRVAPALERSTGRSAHGAYVRVYVRTGVT
ncbi:hypothetical protein [Sanguibacter sp. HDW7]|uniref:hypothetical protein n=1 Tax=Sanguibacter sp. HDW7 TaxID=2714931 RepID=UPI00140D9B76|nr:hypothetical protein [Sanguibacter sp. HDW7]QIK83085.1 hypothetical protein G7063_05180 [Sanguibacter sp. HDW7]